MRKLSLKTYSTYSLKRMSYVNSLNLKKLLIEYETQNSRLFVPLLCWCYLNYKKVENNTNLSYHLKNVYKQYPNINEQNMLSYLKDSNEEELQKYYHSFTSENIRRDESDSKNTYRERILRMKKEKNISSYKLCKMSNTNIGNFYAFLNKGDNNKISLKKCREIMWILKEFEEENQK
jgi:hypothetical protein